MLSQEIMGLGARIFTLVLLGAFAGSWMVPLSAAAVPSSTLRQASPEGTSRADAAEAGKRALQKNGGGRILAVEKSQGGFNVKLLKDGEVRVVFIPIN